MLYLSLFVGKIPVALNPLMMLVSERPLYHTWESKSTNVLFDMPSLGPNTFIRSLALSKLFSMAQNTKHLRAASYLLHEVPFQNCNILFPSFLNLHCKLLIAVSRWPDCKIFQAIDETLVYSSNHYQILHTLYLVGVIFLSIMTGNFY